MSTTIIKSKKHNPETVQPPYLDRFLRWYYWRSALGKQRSYVKTRWSYFGDWYEWSPNAYAPTIGNQLRVKYSFLISVRKQFDVPAHITKVLIKWFHKRSIK